MTLALITDIPSVVALGVSCFVLGIVIGNSLGYANARRIFRR